MPPLSLTVVNGPNLNLLGTREPGIYGHETLADVERRCAAVATEVGLSVDCFQSNSEGAIVDKLHSVRESTAGIVINAGAYTHTSIAIRDALASVAAPFVEVHISNVHARESFRHHSYLSDAAAAVIVGCGTQGYDFAIRRLATLLG
ncbi:type II 3-dehydroquinate dehydratase [Leekyejoonella antrihumi]|uniref:3-dehydroquinate dehydratase n=1 Tax=Leekyejoonella antrihumi TaxID=1660198 RepID=A0A563DUU5_9MICO|nr:type II 3-dehydroquinate dehydratase [Leekyejoonella antrihumi]TWP33949.1 type II 3-dehydroquinate dehydratase [Leekyejoonella antrihumi]